MKLQLFDLLTDEEKEVLPNGERGVIRNVANSPRQKTVENRTGSREDQSIARGLFLFQVETSEHQGNTWNDDGLECA